MKKYILAALTLFCACSGLVAQSVAPFQSHDRVAFVGNSITDGGHYHSFIWLYYMTRFPDMPLWIFNEGIGGDRVVDMTKRLDGDILAKKPNVIVLTFGMNDTGYFEYNGAEPEKFAQQKYDECQANYRQMEKRLQGLRNVRIIQMGGSPYDEVAAIENKAYKGKNANMRRVVAFQRESAEKNGWEFLDLNVPMTEISRRMCVADPGFTLCGGDRIHPDNDGHLVMAYLFLKEQGFAGKGVASVSVDVKKKKIAGAENCEVGDLKFTREGLSFDYLAHALPYPLDTIKRGWGSRRSAADGLRIVPFMEEMNREALQVTGLEGSYRLYIDGQQIGVWSAEEFARGINLAELRHTPQYQQAMTVMLLNEERWEIERRMRDYIWLQYNFFYDKGLLFANDQRAIDAFNAETKNGWVTGKRDLFSKTMRPEIRELWQRNMEDIVETIYDINKPVTRKVTLEKVK